MSLRPTGLIVDKLGGGGVLTVIDDQPDSIGVLLIPGSFNHRRVVERGELEGLGEYHPAADAGVTGAVVVALVTDSRVPDPLPAGHPGAGGTPDLVMTLQVECQGEPSPADVAAAVRRAVEAFQQQ